MTDERTRIALFDKLVEVLGPVHGDALMAHLPPSGWGDMVTKHDLDLSRAEARADFETFRAEMRGEFDTFRTAARADFETFRAEMRGEFDTFRTETRHDIEGVEHRLTAHMAESLATHTRTIVLTVVFSLVGAVLTTAALFLALT